MNPPWRADAGTGPVGRVGRVGFAGVAMLAGALALPGCGPSPDEVLAEARRSKNHVRTQSRDVLGPLATVGSFAFSHGAWSGCGDFGGKALYEVTGRIDPAPQDAGPLVDRVVDRLAAGGIRVRRIHPQEEDPVTFAVLRDGVTMEFYGYTSDPYVLFDIIGPCLDVDDLDRELIDARSTSLDLGGGRDG